MPLVSYAEAAEQVHRFILALADGGFPGETGEDGAPRSAADQGASARVETAALAEASGRVMAEAIYADRDQPPFARATRDGFACRAVEASTNQLLFLAGRLRAGQVPQEAQTGSSDSGQVGSSQVGSGHLNSGEVWEIMTGAPVPEGADAVFMVEYSEHSSNFVRLVAPRAVEPGENIVPRGAEARAGDLLVPPGVRIGAAQIALAAQCGLSRLRVAARPRVAILSTGDELVAVETTPGPSQIRNSNAPMLAALVAAAGGEAMVLAAVPDQEAPLAAVIEQAMAADLLLVSGGISAGRYDLVEAALTRAGARFFFGGVAIQPGKPVVFGQLPRPALARPGQSEPGQSQPGRSPLPFFALPGNPISSAVTFHLFAAPLLAALAEDSAGLPRFALAQLTSEWRGKAGLTRFLPAWCDFGLAPEVHLVPWQGSGDIAAFARSNCFLVVPAEADEVPAGSIVQILLA